MLHLTLRIGMEERKWEDMNPDCLANIFGRLDPKSRVLVIPLVCKPWYQAVRDPLCWKRLMFNHWIARPQTEFIKFAASKSQRCATVLVLPHFCDREELVYVSEECPALKMLALDGLMRDEHKDIFPGLLVKWKNLEFLTIGYCSYILEILKLIHNHLPKFIGLCIKDTEIDDVLASTIVSLLPKIKYLIINQAGFQKECLLLILQGCKELECLDVRHCTGFAEDDEEILKLSSGIKNFQCGGSTAKRAPIDFLEISFGDLWTIMIDIMHIASNIASDLDILYHSWN